MPSKHDLLQRIAHLDQELSACPEISEQAAEAAFDNCVEILGLSSEEDNADIVDAMDEVLRRHGLASRAFG